MTDAEQVLRNLLDACERGRPLTDITDRLRVEVGRLAGEGTTQPEPTATQLYNAVKAKRYDRDAENPILTIPEIHAVLSARSEWLADRTSGEGTSNHDYDHGYRQGFRDGLRQTGHDIAALIDQVSVDGAPPPASDRG